MTLSRTYVRPIFRPPMLPLSEAITQSNRHVPALSQGTRIEAALWMLQIVMGWKLLYGRIIRHFDGTYASVILNRDKAQNDQASRVGLDTFEGLGHRLVGSPSSPQNVEIAQQRFTI